jgi:hypothetical protein
MVAGPGRGVLSLASRRVTFFCRLVRPVRISAITDTRFTLMADVVQRVRVTGFIASQVSVMAVKPPVLSTPARSAGVGNSAPKAMLG